MKAHPALRRGRLAQARVPQHGAVLLFSMITMVILLISAVALVRSFNGSLFNAGNLAFKRDLLNQGERVVPVVMAAMQTGDLATQAARANHSAANNYSASILVTNSRGIPNALLDDTAFASIGSAPDVVVSEQAVTIRYVVDRLCKTTGADAALGPSMCTLADGGAPSGGSASEMRRAEDASAAGAGALPQQVVYRLSIRVTGPRSTQAFFQTTFSL